MVTLNFQKYKIQQQVHIYIYIYAFIYVGGTGTPWHTRGYAPDAYCFWATVVNHPILTVKKILNVMKAQLR